jgi:hypothetical protein
MARRFDGSTGWLLADGTTYNIAACALSCWVKPYTLPGVAGAIAGFQDGTGAHDKTLHLLSDGRVAWFVFDGSNVIVNSLSSLPLTVGRWNHVLGTVGGGGSALYIDGRLHGSAGAGATFTGYGAANFRIGGNLREGGSTTERWLDGAIARVALWDNALTGGQVAQLYALAGEPFSVDPDSLLAYLPLGAGVERDLWGAASNSTLTGTTWLEPDVPPFQAFAAPLSPLLTAAVNIDPEFLNIGVEMFAPSFALEVPFASFGTLINDVNLVEGELPPFVPPSLPPTIPPGSPIGPGVPLPPLSSGGLAGIRFYQGPPWRWLVTDLNSNTITFLDKLAAEVTVTYGLNQGSTAKLSVPSANPEVNILHTDGEPFVAEGNRLLYGFRREGDGPIWQCRFAGKILQVEDNGATEDARTFVTAYDPWQILFQRPMIDIEDTFPDEAGFFSFDDTQFGVMALTFLRNTIIHQGEVGIDMGQDTFATVILMPGTEWWGSPYKAVWSGRTHSEYETTTQIDTNFQQGMMVGEVWQQILEDGGMDILLTPIYDPVNRPGFQAEVSIYERAGRVADEAVFAWDKPSRNLTMINPLKDGTKRANAIRYYEEQGGQPVNAGAPFTDPTSITKYGQTWHQQFYPSRVEEAAAAVAELQLALLADGIKTNAFTPAPERMPFLFTEWWLGDTVPVFASSNLRQSIAAFQRIYGIVVSIDENNYELPQQVLLSPEDA